MQKNVGNQEAYMRIGAGVVVLLLALFITENPTVRIILAVLAAILAGTAFIRTCPINTLLKRNTYEADSKEKVDMVEEAPQENTVMETEMEMEEPKPAPEAPADTPAEAHPMGSGMPMGGGDSETQETEEEKQI